MQPPPPPPRSAPQQPQNSYPPQQPGPAPTGPHYSIDVECVATGTDHNSRDVGQISLIDANENVLLNLYVKPAKPVVSYLTALTGLTAELIEQRGTSLDEAKATLKVRCTPFQHFYRATVAHAPPTSPRPVYQAADFGPCRVAP